jgi:hypothetical protein
MRYPQIPIQALATRSPGKPGMLESPAQTKLTDRSRLLHIVRQILTFLRRLRRVRQYFCLRSSIPLSYRISSRPPLTIWQRKVERSPLKPTLLGDSRKLLRSGLLTRLRPLNPLLHKRIRPKLSIAFRLLWVGIHMLRRSRRHRVRQLSMISWAPGILTLANPPSSDTDAQ